MMPGFWNDEREKTFCSICWIQTHPSLKQKQPRLQISWGQVLLAARSVDPSGVGGLLCVFKRVIFHLTTTYFHISIMPKLSFPLSHQILFSAIKLFASFLFYLQVFLLYHSLRNAFQLE